MLYFGFWLIVVVPDDLALKTHFRFLMSLEQALV